jgi:hypothetical protein
MSPSNVVVAYAMPSFKDGAGWQVEQSGWQLFLAFLRVTCFHFCFARNHAVMRKDWLEEVEFSCMPHSCYRYQSSVAL